LIIIFFIKINYKKELIKICVRHFNLRIDYLFTDLIV
jgi:hypothetical protein